MSAHREELLELAAFWEHHGNPAEAARLRCSAESAETKAEWYARVHGACQGE